MLQCSVLGFKVGGGLVEVFHPFRAEGLWISSLLPKHGVCQIRIAFAFDQGRIRILGFILGFYKAEVVV